MKYVFIVNPVAGKQNPMLVLEDKIRSFCESNSLDYAIIETERPGHAAELAAAAASEASEASPVRVFAVGGDGTLCETANGLIGKPYCELGCIPCGSGNDFNKTFGKAEQYLNLDEYICGPSVEIDAIASEYMNAINICSLGLDAIVCDYANKIKSKNKKMSGPQAYNKAVVKALLGRIYNSLTLTVDDEKEFKGKYLFSLAANGQWYGGGWHSAPTANPCDGELDFIFIKKISKLRALTVISAYKSGKYYKQKRFKKILTHVRGRKIRIQSVKPSIVNIDGECKAINDITFEIMPKALRFVVPSSYLESK